MKTGIGIGGLALALMLAGCGGAGGNASANVAANGPVPGDIEAVAAVNETGPDAAAAPVAPSASVAGHYAIGRWTENSGGGCADIADIEFTATSIILREPGGDRQEILPATYSAVTPDSVTVLAGEPPRPVVATRSGENQLVITSPERPDRRCTLARR